jgi:4-amino-4-deoxy-L-arabinose transferase-like glycosyltransferase
MLTGLALIGLTRPVQSWQVTLAANVLVVVLLALAVIRGIALRQCWSLPSWPLLTVVCLAGLLRLTDLGWSEFQGDEARILLRAMAAIQGVPDALLAHRKVPGEILVTLPFFAQLGEMTELVGRLPFAISGVLGVAAFFILARELFDARVALIAGLLLAVNGYSVAFGRILQYDSLAFFLGTLGVLCSVRFWRDERPHVGLALAGSALLCAAGLIALGAVFFALPAAWLVGARLWREPSGRIRMAALWLWPAVLALVTVGLVVAVEVIGSRAGGVLSYLGPRMGGDRPYWHWSEFLVSANHYLSTPYLALTLGCGALALLGMLLPRLRGGAIRFSVIAVAMALLVAAGSWTRPGTVALVASVVILVAALASPAQPMTYRAIIIWAAAPLLVHGFLVRVPGTHWREAFPGLVLLSAALLGAIPAGPIRRLAVGLGVVFIVAAIHFSWTTLVRRTPEYQMTYPDPRHWLDWTNATGRGIGGMFGISHRHGWKSLAILQERGAIPTSYTTNESPAVAAWYLRQPQGCPLPVAIILRVPKSPQDRNLAVPVPLPPGYMNAGRLALQSRTTITLQVHPDLPTRFGTIVADAFDAEFDRTHSSPWRPIGSFYQADLGAAAHRAACAQTPS